MTNNEWLNLAKTLTNYNPRLNRNTTTIFFKRLRQNPEALKSAVALFGERGLYYATMKDVNRFVADTVGTPKIKKENYQNYEKINKENR